MWCRVKAPVKKDPLSRLVADGLVWLGYGELAVNADNEPSPAALAKIAMGETRAKRNGVNIATEAQHRVSLKSMVQQKLE